MRRRSCRCIRAGALAVTVLACTALAGQPVGAAGWGADITDPSALASDPHAVRGLAHLRSGDGALGLRPGSEFRPVRVRTRGARHYLRARQIHAGIPIFGAETIVMLDDGGAAGYEAAALAVNPALDRLPTAPVVGPDRAAAAAIAWASNRNSKVAYEARPAELQIFAPEILHAAGEPRLVWNLEVGPRTDRSVGPRGEGSRGGVPGTKGAGAAVPGAAYRLLIDAADGAIVRAYPLSWSVLERQIYDSEDTNLPYKTLARSEGAPATGIADVDKSYDQLADVYLFYAYQYGRDGMDGSGLLNRSDVRYCRNSCPYYNAYWDAWEQTLFFGNGWAADDITAHEFTHGVTEYESGLIYENASGAINESMSDIFGEIVDLTNGHGVDDSTVRWFMGEELAFATLRDMRNPPAHGQPDRLGSSLYFPAVQNPNDTNDQGGVHTNSGVGNKLCSLLVDGGVFQGQTVTAMGIYPVAALFYEANTNLLVPSSDWAILYHALRQAALNLNWSAADRANLDRACVAVEIAALYVNDGFNCIVETGSFNCSPLGGPYKTLAHGVTAMPSGATLRIMGGNWPPMVLSKRGRFEASGTVRIGP
jgi:bacillolysin